MIARMWRGWVRTEQANAYVAYITGTGLRVDFLRRRLELHQNAVNVNGRTCRGNAQVRQEPLRRAGRVRG
jgi:hypothetical protein